MTHPSKSLNDILWSGREVKRFQPTVNIIVDIGKIGITHLQILHHNELPAIPCKPLNNSNLHLPHANFGFTFFSTFNRNLSSIASTSSQLCKEANTPPSSVN